MSEDFHPSSRPQRLSVSEGPTTSCQLSESEASSAILRALKACGAEKEQVLLGYTRLGIEALSEHGLQQQQKKPLVFNLKLKFTGSKVNLIKNYEIQ